MYTFTKLHDSRIPKVRIGVGVGSMEFKLKSMTCVTCVCITRVDCDHIDPEYSSEQDQWDKENVVLHFGGITAHMSRYLLSIC